MDQLSPNQRAEQYPDRQLLLAFSPPDRTGFQKSCTLCKAPHMPVGPMGSSNTKQLGVGIHRWKTVQRLSWQELVLFVTVQWIHGIGGKPYIALICTRDIRDRYPNLTSAERILKHAAMACTREPSSLVQTKLCPHSEIGACDTGRIANYRQDDIYELFTGSATPGIDSCGDVFESWHHSYLG